MLVLYSALCFFSLASTISDGKYVSRRRDIYSAVIKNTKNSPVQCYVVWLQPSGDRSTSDFFTVRQEIAHVVDKKLFSVGSRMEPAVLKEIHCGKLGLKAPFFGVESPQKQWEFVIYSNKIVSGPPT